MSRPTPVRFVRPYVVVGRVLVWSVFVVGCAEPQRPVPAQTAPLLPLSTETPVDRERVFPPAPVVTTTTCRPVVPNISLSTRDETSLDEDLCPIAEKGVAALPVVSGGSFQI